MPLRTVVWIHGPASGELLRAVREEAVADLQALAALVTTSVYAGKLRFDHYGAKKLLVAQQVSRLELGAALDVLDRSPSFTGEAVVATTLTPDLPPRSWLAALSAEVVVFSAPAASPLREQNAALIRLMRALGLPSARFEERIRLATP